MKQLIISIGNSDNKLAQADWSDFVKRVDDLVRIHRKWFRGFSPGDAPWQNCLWWIELEEEETTIDFLKKELANIAHIYDQDSIAILAGETEFVRAQE